MMVIGNLQDNLRIKVINKKIDGISSTKNKGLEITTEDYIIYR